jgi:outer membrane protein OmpA-like peptidoglycan-associated protein
MLKTRESGFPTAWVRVIKQETVAAYEGAVTAQPSTVTASVTPQQEKKTTPIATAPTPTSKEPAPSTSKVMAPDTAKVAKEEKFVPQILDNPPADPVYRPQILTNTPVFLSLYNPTNEIVIDGEVEVVDTERSKLIQKVKGNDYLKLPDPNSKSEQLSLIAYSFGYRKVQHEINYKSTEKDTLQQFIALVGNYYMVSFEMVRLHKGDLETLYNVYFYNNAAMMLPESKYELNKLLDMMKYNPKYKVVLHGHTNGNSAGPLITRGPSNDFFSISTDAKRGVGSAKDLSRERAEVIKDWLVTNGISVDRIEVKAWGGKRMIHEKEGPHERKNARVDVEVVEE